ncbi:folic acid synthesis protein [Aspergillus clavatus NRRL 1]|uniref:Folic acid synthesis protein FOL1 n=1 Tax=Aspergillus clavatus (strain ATCC 1007 / CBS 513.65 / DSM 816 / NCTC 3887 / NRRL 1 / QM 1276 / 107) TaxID=344612 RepID=A1C643_ASPCL|nr:folic acid synthesis protein [Aspergillus clavatus NRRL 1]EAW13864.1 folic acid synthesis protein [Aspergillus clavatus NRRL 1]
MHRAYIALGSNVGARVEMIEKACQEMERAHIRVKRTSSLFETAPMYVLDQDPFMNGVCEVETRLGPLELLDTLQSIELALGRKKLIDKGPRSIDLDILLYDQEIFSHERLNIPHKLMLERDFVLRPLCQLIPLELPPLPGQHGSYLSYLQSLPPPAPVPVATTYISPNFPPLRSTDPTRPTHLMAILNVTPDSFSDGGKHWSQDPAALTATIRGFIDAGATIIDIGGESTRPGAHPVGEAEELARVIPVIRHIRTAMPEARRIALSIDTYRAKVAEAACAAGADIINDVSAGTLDRDMLPTMARTGKAVILMHMRGDPATMTSLATYPNGVIADVGAELRERVAAAEAAGVRRWRMILDPGLGFAKNQTQDLAILRDLQRFRDGVAGLEYFPWLMGPSRKRFIGRLTGVEKASERTWGTAATVTASIAGGADIVRVHDVKEMWQVAKVADAIYRVDS